MGEDAQSPPGALSRAAFDTLVESYTRELWVFLHGMTGSDEQARDLTQDTFYDAWRAVQRGAAPFATGASAEEIRRWLYHVAYCRAASALRRRRLIQWSSLDQEVPLRLDQLAMPAFEDAVVESEVMRAALRQLSPEDAACLLLVVVQGFTAAETAAILGAPPQGVARRVSRAKRRLLAAYLAEEARGAERPARAGSEGGTLS